ncbi:MAG: hypothetical protein A2X84_11250 [Desulfuromonadaceae bacterium GWC2_58_13]|nr:MAG: hypothetical protein A2X84_11250 [Desulfuromonadaceae bacterium GWC2_58_13]
MDSKGAKQDPAPQPESLPELLGRLAKSSAAVVHNEIDLVFQQIREKGRAVRGGIVLVATGAVFGIAGTGSLCAASIIQLTTYMSPAIAALVTGVAVSFVGIVFAFIGYGQLKKSIRNP